MKKGFTLVELLATIVILGIISTIAVISIDGMIDHSNVSECENILLSIKSSVKDFISENRFKITTMSGYSESGGVKKYTVTVSELMTAGFLTGSIKDPFDKGKNVNTSKIQLFITLNDDYTYQSVDIKNVNTGSLIECTGDSVGFPG